MTTTTPEADADIALSSQIAPIRLSRLRGRTAIPPIDAPFNLFFVPQ